jgi:hypothetical protein
VSNSSTRFNRSGAFARLADNLPLHGDAGVIDFVVEALAQGNGVFAPVVGRQSSSARLNHDSMRSKK